MRTTSKNIYCDVLDVTGTIPDDASSTTSTTSDGGDQRHHQRSESRIRKLTASITTLAAEKSRLEASFQEDRKKSMLASYAVTSVPVPSLHLSLLAGQLS